VQAEGRCYHRAWPSPHLLHSSHSPIVVEHILTQREVSNFFTKTGLYGHGQRQHLGGCSPDLCRHRDIEGYLNSKAE
jgi:hypothetical protein